MKYTIPWQAILQSIVFREKKMEAISRECIPVNSLKLGEMYFNLKDYFLLKNIFAVWMVYNLIEVKLIMYIR